VKFRSLMISALLVLPALAADAPAPAPSAPPSTKIAVIRFQDAVLTTQEGRQAAAQMRAKFDPRKTELEKRQAELQAMQQKMQSGANMAPDARAKLQADFERGSRDLQRAADDLNAEVQQEEGRVMGQMATRMSEIIGKYAQSNGFSVVLDVSSQQTPVLWAAAASNISSDIVKAYDAAYPVRTPAPATTPAK
jgi:outer membrane protein